MKRTIIRYTTIRKTLEAAARGGDRDALNQWVQLSIGDLEYRLRYADREETKEIQGALRVLDDIREILTGP